MAHYPSSLFLFVTHIVPNSQKSPADHQWNKWLILPPTNLSLFCYATIQILFSVTGVGVNLDVCKGGAIISCGYCGGRDKTMCSRILFGICFSAHGWEILWDIENNTIVGDGDWIMNSTISLCWGMIKSMSSLYQSFILRQLLVQTMMVIGGRNFWLWALTWGKLGAKMITA